MADPSMVPPPAGIGEWFTYIGMGIGGIVAVLVARLGWKSGGQAVKSPEGIVEVQSAIVDSKSIHLLAAAIEAYAFQQREAVKHTSDVFETMIDALEAQTEEIRQLSREIREHAREIRKGP